MKTISRWASHHVLTAAFLIIGCEITNAFAGLLLGLNLLADWPLTLLRLLVVVVVGMSLWARFRSRAPQRRYSTGRWFVWVAFVGNFGLFMLLGGLWGYQEQKPSPNLAAFGSRRVEVQPDTTTRPERTGAFRNKTRSTAKVTSVTGEEKAGKRIAYVLLFALGLVLTYLSVGLACNIACAGYGFYAILTLMLGIGFTAGGIFFLGRAFDKPLLPMRALTPAQRRRTTRRFWLSWLVLIGAVFLLFLVAASNN